MNEDEIDSTPFRFSNSRQERIYRRLLLVGQGPAAFYRDACLLMTTERSLSATTHLVSHLLRETESALRDVIEPAIGESSNSAEKEQPARQTYRRQIEAILEGLNISLNDAVAIAWMRLADRAGEYQLVKLAHRDSLARPRPLDSKFREFWQDMETLLDIILDRFEARYLKSHELVDSLLAKKTPTTEDAKMLRGAIPNNLVTLGYFFDKIDISWLKPLKDVGFFSRPIEPIHDPETGGYRVPPWPESRYLARIASIEPEAVLEIADGIPETENDWIHADLIETALQIPPKLSVGLARKAESWLKSRFRLMFPEKLGHLVIHLAEGGEIEEAFILAEKLLQVMPDSGTLDGDSGGEAFSLPPRPRIHFDQWHYQEILEKQIPRLVEIAGERALRMLCKLLDDAVRLSRRKEAKGEYEDYSRIWCPQIDGHERGRGRDVQVLLVFAVRDAAESMMSTVPEDALRIIDGHSYKVFRRISLHLRRKWPEADTDGTARFLVEPNIFRDFQMEIELSRLLQDLFGGLPKETQEAYFSFIDSVPRPEGWIRFVTEGTGKPPEEEEIERNVRRWQYARLWLIRAYLKAERLRQFGRLKEEFGDLEESEFRPSRSITWHGQTSPKDLDELRNMKLDQLVDFLASWKASDAWEGPSGGGLAKTLRQLVLSEPERFTQNSEKLDALPVIYLDAILDGINGAVGNGVELPWAHILHICHTATGKFQGDSDTGSADDNHEHSWGSVCRTVVNTLVSGFEAPENGIPLELREVVWEILEPLTRDPQPTLEYEAEYGGDNMDPLAMSINTNRCEALRAVIRYTFWVQRLSRDGEQSAEPRTLDEIPEARQVLDYHLDTDVEQAVSIRAVYGARFPHLYLLDSQWASDNVKRIFTPEEHLQKLRDAAWDAYITDNPPYSDILDVLVEEYSIMVDRMNRTSRQKPGVQHPENHLAEHLMLFYWQGTLQIGEPDSLLDRFFKNAPGATREHATEFVGQNLCETEEKIPTHVIDRLKRLWEHRISAVRTEGEISLVELIPFGWWFTSDKFDDGWAIAQLLEVLRMVKSIEPDHRVLEKLASLSKTYPKESVQSLAYIVEGDREGWRVRSWREEARTILANALGSKEESTKEAAEDLINRLCAQGYLEYRDLLS